MRFYCCYNIQMINNEISEVIFLIMCVGAAYSIGKQIGIQSTVDYLEEKGLIEFDDSEK